MATATRPSFPDHATIADYESDGRWDCGHAYDTDTFSEEIRKDPEATPEQIFDRATASWDDEGFEDWASQNELEGHPRAREAFEAWKRGWRACALPKIADDIGGYKLRQLEDLESYYLFGPGDEIIEQFGDLDTAMKELATIPEGKVMYGDGTGPHYTLVTVRGESAIKAANLRVGDTRELNRLWPKFRADRTAAFRRGFRRVNPCMRRNPAMNPAWVARTLAHTFDTMEHGIPPQWMPKQDVLHAKGSTLVSKVTEYGCGAYGCALPTLDPKIVLKITTDDTEAQFAEKLAKTLVVPVCVKYEAVLKTDMTHQGRTITLLWREEAKDIGKLAGKSEDLVADQHAAAQDAFELIVDGVRGADVNAALANWEKKVDAMKKSAELEWLARGMLRVYREQGIFFGDMHAGNIGRCPREGTLRWVITDPGHIVVVQR